MSSPAGSGMLDRRGEYRAGASSLLPLPLPKRLIESAAEQLSKKQRRRAKRADDETVLAISWLHGVDHRPRPVHSSNGFAAQRTSELHFEAQQRVEEAVLRWPSAVCAPDDATSLREMLKGRGGYSSSASQANLAPYVGSRLAFSGRDTGRGGLWPSQGLRRMLRSPEALASFLCECGELSCHTVPVFKKNVRAYSKFGEGCMDWGSSITACIVNASWVFSFFIRRGARSG